ncbi:hypothetical protein Salat_2461400 [Sesamum alatum]|uniref:Uncharacterized protein n=1 Tax=Sesamum alatum TaxID=300844 RepID=A0AAE2CBS5_9LAMI|nr:hypothetical protein Salat_2461400 [Sesamum alatum]
MSHRKIRSHGSVPFSWEEKPGVPKFNHQKSSSDMIMSLNALQILQPDNFISIPPPPCTSQPPRRSYSGKGSWLQDDPFIAALKSCTNSVTNDRRNEGLRQKGNVSKRNNSSKSSMFSCKGSCNVENDNLVKLSKLPPIPKERYSRRSFVKSSE